MSRPTVVACLIGLFAVGVAVGAAAQKKVTVTSAAWDGKAAAEAAEALLELGEVLAAEGSFEQIHVGRVRYLAGQKEAAQAVFDRYSSGDKLDPGNLIRIARVYAQAGEWDKARPVFDRVIELSPKDADWLVEVGAYYNLNGDRARAETLFAEGFALSPKDLSNTLDAAASYLGGEPRRR